MSEGKRKLVILTDWFVPCYKAGGPIQSCFNFAQVMRKEYDIYVVTGDTDIGESAPYPGVVSNKWTSMIDPDIKVYYFSKPKLSFGNMKIVLRDIGPDFMYLNHLFSVNFVLIPLWIWWRGIVTGKLVLCPRGALYDSALHHKSTYFKKITLILTLRLLGIYKKVSFHATNEREKNAILKYFPTEEITVVNNLPTSYQPSLTSIVKESGRLNCIFIARIVPIKNLHFLLSILKEAQGTINLTIIGPKEDDSYLRLCESLIKELPDLVSAQYHGAKPNHELMPIMKQHHLLVLPTTGENFGHSIFEAFVAGRPVLISDQTPWQQLSAKRLGWDLALADRKAFKAALEEAVDWNQSEFDILCASAWNFARNFIDNAPEIEKYKVLFS